jgi:urease accessory protein
MSARWRLLQIADTGFPIGSFAHSAGLEAAFHIGQANTTAGLDAYIRAHLWNVGSSSLPFVAAAHDDPEAVWALDARMDAQMINHVANRASRTQGRTFLATCAQVFEEPAIEDLATRAASREVPAHLAPAFGAVLRALGIDRADTLALHVLLALRGVASAAVRLGIVGPHESHRLQRRHGQTLDAVLLECSGRGPEDAACVAPLLDVFGPRHDQLYARLFQS